MVEKTGSGHIITAAERIDIRRMRLEGRSQADIAEALGCGRANISKAIRTYDLDGPGDDGELAWLMLWEEFRRYKALLESDGVEIAERIRLSSACAQLGGVLIRTRAQAVKHKLIPLMAGPASATQETDMTDQSKAMAERARILALGEEELRDEIRCLAGLEDKQSVRCDERDDGPGRDAEAVSQSLPLAGARCTKAAER